MIFSIVIPTFRSTNILENLVEEIVCEMKKNNFDFEIILVLDGGKNEVWQSISSIKNKFASNIKAIKLSKNFGQHNATIAGFKYCLGDYIITMDEDLQHSPKDILHLINKQKKMNADVVYGKFEIKKHNLFRNYTSWALKQILKKGVPDLHHDYSSFRLIKSNIAKQTLLMNNAFTFLDGYLSWITNNVESVVVSHSEDATGKSSYTMRKLIQHSLNILFTFSDLPVKILTWFSLLFFTLSTFYSGYILLRKFILNDFAKGFPTFAIMIGLGLGLIFLGLSIIGQYLIRINSKTTQRPTFYESETLI
jgi:undecaprenyl-phosphate 4-deoxy-4-formamido-L-arabinose transferase